MPWVVSGNYIVDNIGIHSKHDSRYVALYTIPSWQQAALIQQASLQYGEKARDYFSRKLAPYITLAF